MRTYQYGLLLAAVAFVAMGCDDDVNYKTSSSIEENASPANNGDSGNNGQVDENNSVVDNNSADNNGEVGVNNVAARCEDFDEATCLLTPACEPTYIPAPCPDCEGAPECECLPAFGGCVLREEPRPVEVSCIDDSDCARGELCLSGPLPPFCPDPDCSGEPEGPMEPASVCVEGCRNSDDCEFGETCVGSRCEPQSCEPDGEAECGDVRPDCPNGMIGTVRDRCHVCVDAETCEAPVWTCDQAWRSGDGQCRGLGGVPHPPSCCGDGDPPRFEALATTTCDAAGQRVVRIVLSPDERFDCNMLLNGADGPGTNWIEIEIPQEHMASQRIYPYQGDPNDRPIAVRACYEGSCNDVEWGTVYIGIYEPGEFITGGADLFYSPGISHWEPFMAAVCGEQRCP